MENEHKIIIVMLAVIIYLVLDNCKCKDTKVEGFRGDCGTKPMPREGYRGISCDVDPANCGGSSFAQHIRRGTGDDLNQFAQRVNTREGYRTEEPSVPFTSSSPPLHINSTDISGGQYVRHHIRNNLKNSMINHINNGN